MSNTKTKLLVVDDEPATRTLLSQIFEGLGFEVRSAEDGFSALEQIRTMQPDILLSDLNMPGMSGFELLSVVRRRLPSIYVIATSGAFMGDSIPHGLAADAFYEKATNLRNLLRLMKEPTQPGRENVERPEAATPIWIQVPISAIAEMPEDRREPYISIACPECLRTFSEALSAAKWIIHETTCLHCQTAIHYVIIQSADPASAQSYLSEMSKPVLTGQHTSR